MKKTFFGYIFREITGPFLLGMGVFTMVLLMGKLLKLAELVFGKGVPLAAVLRIILYMLPSFWLIAIPMAFLLAVLLAMGRLSADSEITAMKSCGISLYGLLPPVFTFALLAYLATTFVSVSAMPRANLSLKNLLHTVVETGGVLEIKERVFDDTFHGVVMYVDRYDRDKNLISGVMIHDERKADEPSTTFAKTGSISVEPSSKTIRLHLTDGGIHRALPGKGYRLIGFSSYDLSLTPSRPTAKLAKSEREMTMGELRQSIHAPSKDDPALNNLILELHSRFAMPLSCIIFALIGVPLGIQNRRSGKAGGFSVSIAILLAFYLFISIAKNLGERGIVYPAVAAWLPNFAFLIMGFQLFRLAAHEVRVPVYDLTANIITWFKDRFGKGKTP
ncbi:MAG: LPS export ABC transporter permease LptF [Geobacter sp.]|nr:LPS export ABC transporter permease LptF [Geobacter sp.]